MEDPFRAALECEGFWPEGGPVETVETLISRLFLVGDRAYKLKKPVNFGFVDFSTVEKRRFYCEEELRLNRRLSPDLYLAVRCITGSATKPEFEGAGEVIDAVVEMRRFDERDLMNRAEAEGRVTVKTMEDLAKTVAAFHERCPRAPEDRHFGDPEEVAKPMEENFRHLLDGAAETADESLLRRLRSWAENERRRCSQVFAVRKRQGRIRECHGDLHLGNILLRNGEISLFDCIEFNEDLRWIDTISEVAFCVMDLASNGRDSLAHTFLNTYLEVSGDYDGTAVLRYYLCYRALVRAKVAWLRIRNMNPEESRPNPNDFDDYRKHLAVAERYAFGSAPFLIVMHGLSGSGKSYGGRKFVESLGAIRIRSDVERKRIAAGAGRADLYSPEMNVRTYDRLHAAASVALNAGLAVVLDATYLREKDRLRAMDLAERVGAPFRILHVTADRKTLEDRLRKRQADAADPSDADLSVVRIQMESMEPMTEAELACTITVNTEDPVAWDRAIRGISGLATRFPTRAATCY